MKNILIGCEESQTVCKAFRKKGFNAYSCDIEPTRGRKKWHMQMDVKKAIVSRKWDLIILHPSCQFLAVSGNRWYGKGKDGFNKRLEAIIWTLDLWLLATGVCDKVALENPKSVIFPLLPNVFYIQPWMFGHGEVKATGFAVKGLPELKPTKIVEEREERVFKMGPSENRVRDRSETYKGIAKAIVKQWGVR